MIVGNTNWDPYILAVRDRKTYVRVATTANITLSGVQIIDGVTLVANDIVLVKNQTTGSENGVYSVASGTWKRHIGADESAEMTPGTSFYVLEGSVNGSSLWVISNTSLITIGATAITFRKISDKNNTLIYTGVNATYDYGILHDSNGSLSFGRYLKSTGALDTTLMTVSSSSAMTIGSIAASGNISAFSDARLKEDLTVIQDALSKVNSLTGYTYIRKDTHEKQTGLVAQDVQKILPEAVTDDGRYLSIAYGNLVGLLVEAIKELTERVEALEKGV